MTPPMLDFWFWGMCPFAILVSVIYFCASPKTQNLSTRLLASAHGVSIVIIFLGAFLISYFCKSQEMSDLIYEILMAVPVSLIIISFFLFRGSKIIHLLQLVNLFCLLWSAFSAHMIWGPCL